MSENVIVCVRCRPFNQTEKNEGHSNIVSINDGISVQLRNPDGGDNKNFAFDCAFGSDCQQVEVYNATARRIVDAALEGFNGTVFAYGQTGTGKTFSMQGTPDNPGIIPLAFQQIFDTISQTSSKQFLVRVSFLEIYNEEIRDLLMKQAKNVSPNHLDLKEHPEHGVYVKDLSSYVVKNVNEMEKLMKFGNNNRAVGATLMNAQSSRSHSIFTITIESSEKGPDGQEHYKVGKLNLVDLAGSERQSKTGATGDRLKEATKINLSLSALGNCISALVDGRNSHIPYRDSKLTRLLQDSLGGNSKTVMIATLSPASYNYEETLSTLRYANRAKNIKNKPKINEDPKDAMIRQYQEEINRLRAELDRKKINLPSQANVSHLSEQDEEEEIDVETDEEVEKVGSKKLSKLQAKIEAEKKELLQSKTLVAEEKEKAMKELEIRAQELEAERSARVTLSSKLRSMEEKLLEGGKNIKDRIHEQEREIQRKQLEMEEQARKARELQKKLNEKQEEQSQLEGNYSSLQEECDIKTKKLKKLWAKYEEARNEINDLQDEFRSEREDLLGTIRELSRELSLRVTIIENFVPIDDRLKVERRSSFDEDLGEWILSPFSNMSEVNRKFERPIATSSSKTPLSQYAKNMIRNGDPNLRYRKENIITMTLDMPERTTYDMHEYPQEFKAGIPGSPTKSAKRPGTASKSQVLNEKSTDSMELYPEPSNKLKPRSRYA